MVVESLVCADDDMLDSKSDLAKIAAQKFKEHFEYALKNYFAKGDEVTHEQQNDD